MAIGCTTTTVTEPGDGFDINAILPIAIAGAVAGAVLISAFAPGSTIRI